MIKQLIDLLRPVPEIPEGCIKVYFIPQPDITVQELADVVSNTYGGIYGTLRGGVWIPKAVYDAFGPIKRHWSLTSEALT